MVQLLSVHVIFTMGSLSFESFMVSFTYCMIHLSVCSGELAEGLYNMVFIVDPGWCSRFGPITWKFVSQTVS
jgi:hypothetical protein